MQIFQGISFRLAKAGIILALFVGIVMNAIQISADYVVKRDEIDQTISRLVSISSPSATRALYSKNKILADEVTQGFLNYPFVLDVMINNTDDKPLSYGQQIILPSGTSWLTRLLPDQIMTFHMPLVSKNTGDDLGSLSFSIDIDAALKPFYKSSLFVIAIGLLRSSLIVFLLFFVFHLMLTKPLIRIANEMKNLSSGKPEKKRLSLPKSKHDDELKQLIVSGNKWLDAVDASMQKRSAVEDVLRKSEGNVRQIIDSLPISVGARNFEGYYIFANKALANFMQVDPETIRGSHVSKFADFFMTSVGDIQEKDKQVILSKQSTEVWEEQWLDKDGMYHQMHTHIMPMDFYDDTVALVVSSDISELKSTQALMEHMAYHDALTDLPNRSYLEERLQKELVLSVEHQQFGALLFIDLDQFKNVNDSLGHPVGDSLLKHVSQRLKASVKNSDVVVRLGGDEFVILLLNLGEDLSAAIFRVEEASERIRSNVSQSYNHDDIELHITCSIGIVLFPEENAGVHELLSYADTAMYHVKDQGRNAVQFFNQLMADNVKNMLTMEGDLHKALENSLFSLHYQTRVHSNSSKVVGAEALLRWDHPENGLIPPADFIPVLEATGLIVDVGLWVIKEAITQVKKWEALGVWSKGMCMGVNISPRQLRSPSFVSDVKRLLEEECFCASMLEMEVTEGVVVHNVNDVVFAMEALRSLGVRFALDDFGTGYSSISYLKELPVSVLKIDKSFVRDITSDPSDRILVEAISTMGNMLSLQVVAEGVETAEQLKVIQQIGCEFYQGYLCCKPLAPLKFFELLESSPYKCIDTELTV